MKYSKFNKFNYYISWFLILFILFPFNLVLAQQPTEAAKPQLTQNNPAFFVKDNFSSTQESELEASFKDGVYSYPLFKFMEQPRQIYLANSTSELALSLPISERITVKSAQLHLEFSNSIALLKDRSELRVSIDDIVIAQFVLRPAQPFSIYDISLPTQLLKPGYRKLKFWVAQHYTLQCEDPAAPELWTQVDSIHSRIILNADMKPINLSLAHLDNIIDSKLWDDYELNIIIGTSEPKDSHLFWGSLIAQGASLRLHHKPLYVNCVMGSNKLISSNKNGKILLGGEGLKLKDNVLVGTASELATYISPNLLAEIKSPFIGIYPLDQDPRYFTIVISGGNEEDVSKAVTAFSFINFPFPDQASTQIKELSIPDFPDYASERAVRENASYKFSYFGQDTTTYRGISAGEMLLSFRLPPDIFASEASVVEMSLHFSYGAALRKDSVLNIFLNEKFENVIQLREELGATYQDYKIRIPLRSFRAGLNTVKLSPKMVPFISGGCVYIQEENLQLTIFKDSTLTFPNANHYVKMPDLKLLSSSAFPFSMKGDGEGFGLQVLGRDPETIASAWTIAGKLAQVTSIPLYKIQTTFSQFKEPLHTVMVGTSNVADPKIIAAAPLSFNPDSNAPYTTKSATHPDGYEMSWITRVYKYISKHWQIEEVEPKSEILRIQQTGKFGKYASLMEFQSPQSDKSILWLTADNPENLHLGSSNLVKPDVWEQLQGDLTVWTTEAKKVGDSFNWQKAGKDYYLGSLPITGIFEFYFSNYPIFWTIVLLFILVTFTIITRYLLRAYKNKFHPHVGDGAN